MRGSDLHRLSSVRAATCALAVAGLLAVAGCGGSEPRQDAEVEGGEFEARVVGASIESVQRLARTNMMRLAVRNTGAETIPNLAVTVKLLSPQGLNAREAFQYRDPQENLARPDRPVWVMDREFPIRLGSGESGAAGTPSPRTFAFGELEPGEVARIVWKLTPVDPGRYRIFYELAPDIYGTGTVTDGRGEPVQGALRARILAAPQRLRVTDDGRVVPITREPGESQADE